MNPRNLILSAAFTAIPAFIGTTALAADSRNSNGQMLSSNQTSMNSSKAPNLSQSAMNDIRDELGQAVDAAVSSDPVGQVTNNLSKADRDRMAADHQVDSTDLQKAAGQFQKDWHAKYGEDFDAKEKASMIFTGHSFQIMQGNTPVMMSMEKGYTVNPNTGKMTTGNRPASDKGAIAAAQNVGGTGSMMRGGDIKSEATKDDAARVDSNGRPIDDSHGKDTAAARQLGQQIGIGTGGAPAPVMSPGDRAMVKISGGMHMKHTVVNLVNEGAGSGWRVILKDQVTPQQLNASLLKQINAVDGMQAKWPDDLHAAYVAVSKHMLMGIANAGTDSGT